MLRRVELDDEKIRWKFPKKAGDFTIEDKDKIIAALVEEVMEITSGNHSYRWRGNTQTSCRLPNWLKSHRIMRQIGNGGLVNQVQRHLHQEWGKSLPHNQICGRYANPSKESTARSLLVRRENNVLQKCAQET